MTIFIMKPVHWNTLGYSKPSGHRASSGFPKDFGFGHEEWNNSSKMEYKDGEKDIKTFHTEGIDKKTVNNHDDKIVVFMYASHDRVQELVGVAGSATCLTSDDRKIYREKLTHELRIDEFKKDAWDVNLVRECFDNKFDKFIENWDVDLHWIPNWICPKEHYFHPTSQVLLDSQRITGKSKLITRFKSYQLVDRSAALKVMLSVPASLRNQKWTNIFEEIAYGQSAIDFDLAEIEESDLPLTERLALRQARIGQGAFRAQLLARWDAACAVTSCSVSEALRASHIKPWCDSNYRERLNPHNGLLLTAHLDALFDKGLIAFDGDGMMIVSGKISEVDRRLLGVPASLRKPLKDEEKAFLSLHRNRFFNK